MNLQPENGGGLTVNNHTGVIECEFDSDETIDNFQLAGLPWWQAFKAAVDADGCVGCFDLIGFSDQGPFPNGHFATQMMGGTNGVFAIVTGLMGLDCGHSCQSELHPVYALAMNVQPSTQSGSSRIFWHSCFSWVSDEISCYLFLVKIFVRRSGEAKDP